MQFGELTLEGAGHHMATVRSDAVAAQALGKWHRAVSPWKVARRRSPGSSEKASDSRSAES